MKQTWFVSAAAVIFSDTLIGVASSPQAVSQKPAPDPAKSTRAAANVPDPPVKDMTAEQEDKWAADTEALIDKACISCHPLADIVKVRKTWANWHTTVVRMAALGIEADEDQLTAMKLYLTRYYGVVNVNKGSAAELAAVLGLSTKDAATIVAYRKANGDFADADALIKVEGVNKAKLIEAAGPLRFK